MKPVVKLSALLVFAAILSAGCSTAAPDSPTQSSTVATTDSQPVSESSGVTELAVAEIERDEYAESNVVTSVTAEDGTSLIAKTTLVDPRGDSGSSEAERATFICEAARRVPGIEKVKVMEAVGTHWIVYGENFESLVPGSSTSCGEY
ncbi:hypothetical protein [Citricoccus alkalitolerans]|uniref:Uncharacterized protein n=1 Tax=Citricoccus alkalitolerans TaxID=246603 RepID=A0ABV8XXR6_9MICC